MWSTRTRIRLLDDWGVDAAVVFPTIGILWDKEEDPELAMAYARAYNRCLRLGFKGVFVAPEPVCGKRPSHPDFDPLWRELQAADLPLCLHVIVRLNRTVGGVTQWFDRAKGESNTVFGFGLGGTYQLIPAISALVCDGLFDRFPRLKALVVETGLAGSATSWIASTRSTSASELSEARRRAVLGENAQSLFRLA